LKKYIFHVQFTFWEDSLMKNVKTLKIISLLMILISIFGIAAGILGFIDTVNMRKAKEAELALLQSQISQIETDTAALNAKKAEYDSDVATLARNKASYESDKAAYDMLKSAVDAKAAELKAEKAAGQIDSASISATQSILDEGEAKLEAGKAKLTDYEAAQIFVDNYKAEQAAVISSLNKLSQNSYVAAMNNSGQTNISAAKEGYKLARANTSRQVSAGIYLCAVSMIISVLSLFAAVKVMTNTKFHRIDNIRDAIFLGLTSFVLALAANVFDIMNNYPGSKLLSAALAGEAFFVLLFVITMMKFRKALAANGGDS
jgi:hypothetical protein